MTRWDWTWEERSHKSRAPTVVPDPAGDEHDTMTVEGGSGANVEHRSSSGEDVFRRRRIGAGLGLLAIVVLAIVAIGAKGGSKPAPAITAKSHVAKLSPSAADQVAAARREERKAIESVLAYTPAITSGGPTGNEVALTFDDGPGPYTQQLVAELNRLNVKATFFAVGNQEQYFSAGTVDEINSGDVVGDHTQTHTMMSSLSPHDQYEQLFDQMVQIEVLGGTRPRLFRPPYGAFNAITFRELHHLHLLMVLWSVDTADYTVPGTEAIVRRALAGAKPGAIVLMHDAGGNRTETIAALPEIVKGLRKRGLHPVTVPRLLRDDPPLRGQAIPSSLTGG